MLGVLCALPVQGAQVAAKETGFAVLPEAHQTEGDGIEVLVFFGYQCTHCYHFYQSELLGWKERGSADVTVRLAPVVWSPAVEPAVRALHVVQRIGDAEAFHGKLFEAYQREPGRFSDPQALAELAHQCCNIDPEVFLEAYNAEEINAMRAVDEQTVKGYRIEATPTVIVAGKYLVRADVLPPGKRMIDVIDSLVARERNVRAGR